MSRSTHNRRDSLPVMRWARGASAGDGDDRSHEFAKRVVDAAQAYDIPIRGDAELLNLLSRVVLYRDVSPETYKGISALLAFVYETARSTAGRKEVIDAEPAAKGDAAPIGPPIAPLRTESLVDLPVVGPDEGDE